MKNSKKTWGMLGTSMGSMLIIVALLTMVGMGSNDTYAATTCKCPTGYNPSGGQCAKQVTETVTCSANSTGATAAGFDSTGKVVYKCTKTSTKTTACGTDTDPDPGSGSGSGTDSEVKTCDAGKYYRGNGMCYTCPAGSYCPGGSLGATSCPAGTTSPAGSSSESQCQGNGDKTNCKAGQYYRGNGMCYTCPAGSYCPEGSLGATSCPSGTTSPAGSSSESDCKSTSSDVVTCGAGKYYRGNGMCYTCPAGSYCPEGSLGATSCPAGTTSPAGSSSESDCKSTSGNDGDKPSNPNKPTGGDDKPNNPNKPSGGDDKPNNPNKPSGGGDDGLGGNGGGNSGGNGNGGNTGGNNGNNNGGNNATKNPNTATKAPLVIAIIGIMSVGISTVVYFKGKKEINTEI